MSNMRILGCIIVCLPFAVWYVIGVKTIGWLIPTFTVICVTVGTILVVVGR